MLPFVLLGIAGLATATGLRRLVPEWRMRTLGARVEAGLADAAIDLASLSRELRRVLDTAFLHRLAHRRRNKRRTVHRPALVEQDLRLLRAVISLERAELSITEYELSRCRPELAATRLVRVRLGLVRDGAPEVELALDAERSVEPLGTLLLSDTRAQLALARGEPLQALDEPSLPLTHARALAALGRVDEASAILRAASAARIDAMCRLHPADPATRLAVALRAGASPYR